MAFCRIFQMNSMPFRFDTQENYLAFEKIVGVNCALTWNFHELFSGTAYGVYSEKSKKRFWGFPRDEKVMEYRRGVGEATVYLASKHFRGQWDLSKNILVNNDGDVVASAQKAEFGLHKEPGRKQWNLLKLEYQSNNFFFKEVIATPIDSGVTLRTSRALYNSNGTLLIFGDCLTRELVLHRFDDDMLVLYPCFVALFSVSDSD